METLISPSLLSADFLNLRKDIEMINNSEADWLHLDIMDGHFVPNLMLGTESVKHLRAASSIPLDIHLMIERPEDKLAWFDPQPGEYVSVHAESTRHLQRALSRIRECGMESERR